MTEIQAADIFQPRWDASQKPRAQRILAGLGVAHLAAAVVGAAITVLALKSHPLGWLLLVAGPALVGIGLIKAAIAVRFAVPIGRMIAKFAAPIFFGGVIASIVGIWLFVLVLRFVDAQMAADAASPARAAVVSSFGLPLTVEEIRQALPGVWQCPVNATVLWPLQIGVVRDIIGLLGVVGFVNVFAMVAIWGERKVSARMQSRLGPMRVGGWHGWAQSLADGIKLLNKEDLIPGGADGALFRLAPYLAFAPALSAFLALPFGTYWVVRNLDVGLIFVLAMLGIEVIGVILAGWASNNKWSLYGAMREACQMVSYEIPMGLALLVPVMTAGTLDLVTIGDMQSHGWTSWLGFANPFLFAAMLTYFVASLASVKRAPFDLPEAESELVAGFMTEYSGFRWCLFFFAEYAAMFVVSGLLVTLFLGAWNSPLPASWGQSLANGSLPARAAYGLLFSGPLWFVFKSAFLVYVQMWLRWTLPRIRLDQVLYACVQVMLPLAMAVLLGNTLWMLWVSPDGVLGVAMRILFSLVGAVLAGGFVVIMLYGWVNRRRLVGSLVVDHLPGGVGGPCVGGAAGGAVTIRESVLEAALFYLFAAVAVGSAVAIVVSTNIVRAATWLLGTLGAVAALYFLMSAYFLGAIQLIVYAGGTLVLIIFGVMLTTRTPSARFAPRTWERVLGAAVCSLLFVVLSVVLLRADWAAHARPAEQSATVAQFGDALLTTYLVPFEVASVLLLAVMIGAAYLARPEKRQG